MRSSENAIRLLEASRSASSSVSAHTAITPTPTRGPSDRPDGSKRAPVLAPRSPAPFGLMKSANE